MVSEKILEEKNSLEAISSLEQSDFPYAATLLVYVVLERCLKLHMLENRKNRDIFKLENQRSDHRKYVDCSDPELFIARVLTNLTLGELEQSYGKNTRYFRCRDEVFHANFHLTEQTKDAQERHRSNLQHLSTAKDNLRDASRRLFAHPITVIDGVLQFDPDFLASRSGH